MERVVYAITIPIPVQRTRDEWSITYHQILFEEIPTKRELLFFLHQKGDEEYVRTGSKRNFWWDMIDTLNCFPKENWIDRDYDLVPHFHSAIRPFEHPIMGLVSILWEKKTVETFERKNSE